MIAFILATDFDFIDYMSKMAFFFSFFFFFFFEAFFTPMAFLEYDFQLQWKTFYSSTRLSSRSNLKASSGLSSACCIKLSP